ncbi:MAG: gluconate 2-dehydrogenase subunit 3 family protein [Gammaproteobacteria bacterium]|nr:gluconate 2-dehydrogenase subunit 3 family protein [Gammaproteobacteria bacterium]MBU2180284.1 gluconate 2-dehydrogenase subunit 3 family protein [Gammaproteobacteria bacterium]MBU2223996.1 gluconate 2-dehydrogenase subunit 3 family protein [Gammaproteobacteria bacterium]MBU2278388.1 gluconate 2-dehydrogenase subunit 3 family protein [Gammaproteobacteria bacterium]MBU2427879.1 gluconate 2-dehydrogenase subunit 3 family protein [Gammaproteobacteria bacterium]
MERRDLLKMIAAATGFAFVGGEVWANGLTTAVTKTAKAVTGQQGIFSAADVLLLDEIAETILPKTTTAGAKDAACGAQMAVQISDCYSATEQGWFIAGLVQLQQRSQQDYKLDFMKLSNEQRHQLLVKLDTEAKTHNAQVAATEQAAPSGESTPHYFTLFKQLTLFVFFTSKVGATEVLRYSAIPGKYDGNLPYKKGDRAWAT